MSTKDLIIQKLRADNKELREILSRAHKVFGTECDRLGIIIKELTEDLEGQRKQRMMWQEEATKLQAELKAVKPSIEKIVKWMEDNLPQQEVGAPGMFVYFLNKEDRYKFATALHNLKGGK